MGIDHFETDEVHVLDTNSSRVNPATSDNQIPPADFDTDNSRDTPFAAGEEWFGEWVEYGDWPGMILFCLSSDDFEVEIQWSNDGVTQDPGLLGSTPITTFPSELPGVYSAVHDANIPVNKYYRVRVKNLAASATLFTSIRFWRLRAPFTGTFDNPDTNPNSFSLAFLTKAILAGKLPDGTFSNVILSPNSSVQVKVEGSDSTPSGATWNEGTLNYIRHDFGQESVADEVALLRDLSSGGTVTADTVNGGAVFSTGAAPGSTAIFLSEKKILYNENTGHGVVVDISLFEEPDSAGITGDAYVEWGYGDGAGNGTGWGYDATGFYTFLKKGDVYTHKTYQTDWNGDPLDGSSSSQFTRAGTPEVLDLSKDNLYRFTGEFLYAAEQNYFVKRPRGQHLLAHTHEYPNSETALSLKTANLHNYIEIHNDTTSGGDLKFRSGSWRGGVFSNRNIQSGRQPDGDLVDTPADGASFPPTLLESGLAAEGSPVTFTADAGTDTFTSVAHGLSEEDPIVLTTTGTLPAGLNADTVYFVTAPTADTFQLAVRPYGSVIDIADAGTGTHSFKTRDYVILGISDTDQWRSLEVALETEEPGFLYLGYIDDVQAANPVERAPVVIRSVTQDLANQGGARFNLGVHIDGFRVRYVNGPNATPYFRAWTQQRVHAIQPDQLPVAADIDDTTNSAVVRSVIAAKDSVDGSYNNILATPISDSIVEPVRNLDINAYTLGYDDTSGTWNRIRSRQPVDNMTNPGKALNVAGFTMLWNPNGSPANRWNRAIGRLPADAMSNDQVNALSLARLQVFNGSTWDRVRGDITNGLDVDVTRTSLDTEFNSEFTRIKEKRFKDTEQVKHDIPAVLVSGIIYSGKAPTGTATSATGWSIVRTTFDANGNPSSEGIALNATWDNRATETYTDD